MWRRFRDLMEMIRVSHTLFALPFALFAAVLAWTMPTPHQFIQFRWAHLLGLLLAFTGARSAAMAFNRLVDRGIDAANERTKSRHLPAGRLSVRAVIGFVAASIVVYLLGILMFWPNYLLLFVAVAVLAVLFGYSYAKRFTALAHFWLGLALSLAPFCVWIALRGGEVVADPWDVVPAVLLAAAVLFWVAGFDIIYACQDYEFDKSTGLKSVPVLLGIAGALRLAACCHAGMVVWLVGLLWYCQRVRPEAGLGWLFGASIAALAALLIYEHLLVRPEDLSRVNVAFFNVNAVISVGLFVFGSVDLLWIG